MHVLFAYSLLRLQALHLGLPALPCIQAPAALPAIRKRQFDVVEVREILLGHLTIVSYAHVVCSSLDLGPGHCIFVPWRSLILRLPPASPPQGAKTQCFRDPNTHIS